jgi:hypothetical protein
VRRVLLRAYVGLEVVLHCAGGGRIRRAVPL